LRKILLVLQLSISAVVVTATVIVMAQLNYIKQADLGFNKDNVMILSVPGGNQSEYFLQTLEKQPFVKKVAVSDYFPGASYKDEHLIEMKNGEMKTRTVQRMFIDHHFVDLLNLKMVAGRNFNTRFETDFREAFLVNETAARAFGWREPVGKKIEAIHYGKKGVVIGVVNDANLFSLHKKIEPIVIQLSARNAGEGPVAYVKLDAPAKSAYISRIQAIHQQAFGQVEFGYSFLDDRYRNLYKSDEKLGEVLLISSIIILLISCSGLFALSSFIAVQRAREMGIRKIMGASDRQIFLLYIRNFTILAVIANLVAWPLAHFMMTRWLEDFTFRTDVSFGFHLLAVAITMVIVEVTVGIHALKLARLNLINILKM
jgi:putative ABC transport system permease protein